MKSRQLNHSRSVLGTRTQHGEETSANPEQWGELNEGKRIATHWEPVSAEHSLAILAEAVKSPGVQQGYPVDRKIIVEGLHAFLQQSGLRIAAEKPGLLPAGALELTGFPQPPAPIQPDEI
jgi:hypothetical protein